MEFSTLPETTQKQVKQTLCAYSRVSVYHNQTRGYYTSTAVSLHTGIYDTLIGEYYAKDLFTIEERILNYVNTFREFPLIGEIKYTGHKDWQALNGSWESVELVNGNLIFKG